MKNTFLLLLISLVLLGCKKDEIGNAHIEGYVTNRVTGDPVQDLEVSIYEPGWGSSVTISVKTTDSMGYFLFNGNYQKYNNSLVVNMGNALFDYQRDAFINGELKSIIWGIQTHGHSSEPQTFNIGLYPITSFKIIVNNIPPAADDDIINISIPNGNIGSYENIGVIQNRVIYGRAYFENELILNYDVTSNGVVTPYQKILECIPGEETTFELNY